LTVSGFVAADQKHREITDTLMLRGQMRRF
jgi:hypothetical protein